MFRKSVSFDQAIEASKKGGEANIQKMIEYVDSHRTNPREIFKRDKGGKTLLAYASENGHADIFQIILSGLDIQLVLMNAVTNGSDSIFYMLLPLLDLKILTNIKNGLTVAETAEQC